MNTPPSRWITGSLAATALLAMVALAAPRDAEAQVRVGPQISYGEGIEAMAVGGRVSASFPGVEGIGVAGSFDFFFPEGDVDYWELNGNATYTFPGSEAATPYLGAGMNLANISVTPLDQTTGDESETEVGVNVLGGLKIAPGAPVTPYVEGRFGSAFDGQFVITGGILF